LRRPGRAPSGGGYRLAGEDLTRAALCAFFALIETAIRARVAGRDALRLFCVIYVFHGFRRRIILADERCVGGYGRSGSRTEERCAYCHTLEQMTPGHHRHADRVSQRRRT